MLQAVHAVVRHAAPDTKEVISYQMPANRQGGIWVDFAAFKHHLGFFSLLPRATFN